MTDNCIKSVKVEVGKNHSNHMQSHWNKEGEINEDLEERHQVTKEEIREWHGASEIKLN